MTSTAAIATLKATCRKHMRERRQNEQRNSAKNKAHRALAALQGNALWARARLVGCYMPSPEEFPLTPDMLLDAGDNTKTLTLPRVEEPGVMTFRTWRQGQPLELGLGGIMQPLASADIVAPSALEWIFIPLLACDDHGYRLGYGGGYYDRVLPCTQGVLCGVGYAFQRINDVPREAHDQALHCFLSEEGLESFRNDANNG
jgi:5-formyltetrahydrofolate cyclo-ligase